MTILIFLLVLGVLIFVHELGHFLAAKHSRVKVFEFAIGFPPTLFKKTVRGTKYILNLLPLGGYVRLLGENGEDDVPEPPTPDQGEKKEELPLSKDENFSNKPPLVKTYILAAGVIMNLLLAWILFSVCLMFGYPVDISSLEGEERGYLKGESFMIVTNVLDESPASVAGLKSGDRILSVVDQEDIVLSEDLVGHIRNSEEETIEVSVLRGDESMVLALSPALGLEGIEEGVRGVGVGLADAGVVAYPFFTALGKGFVWTINATVQTAQGLGQLLVDSFRGQADLSSVSGPVGIVSLVGEAYSVGLLYLLSFTAIISINLALINILPIPALDGGRILFVWIERIKGSPISTKTQLIVNGIGFGLLIFLMVVVTVRDVIKIFN